MLPNADSSVPVEVKLYKGFMSTKYASKRTLGLPFREKQKKKKALQPIYTRFEELTLASWKRKSQS